MKARHLLAVLMLISVALVVCWGGEKEPAAGLAADSGPSVIIAGAREINCQLERSECADFQDRVDKNPLLEETLARASSRNPHTPLEVGQRDRFSSFEFVVDANWEDPNIIRWLNERM